MRSGYDILKEIYCKQKMYSFKIKLRRAKDFDSRPKSEKRSSLLLGEVEMKRIDFETADTRSVCEIMRDKWLMQSDFTPIRETDEFKELVKALTA